MNNYSAIAPKKYSEIYEIIASLINNETNLIANLANTCAVLKEHLNHLWIGFYLVDDNDLILGPFQGPLACTRIPIGKGVCGTAWKNKESIIVPNVHEFPGHIACNSLSNAEIVIPLKKDNKIIGVLDIDSIHFNAFSEHDKEQLERIIALLN